MEISAVRLATRNLEAQRAFYTVTLGLPLIEATASAFTVGVGPTMLTFEAASDEACYHLAFTIPANKLVVAKAWLVGRANVLTQDGVDEFSSQLWNAQQIYFRDPAGNILEFIARHNLSNAAPGDFGEQDILSVSEVGLPVDDVPGTVAALTADLGLPPYREQSASFAPVGDDHGLFIVVRSGRPWFPTAQAAAVHPVAVTIRGECAQEYRLATGPYQIAVAAG